MTPEQIEKWRDESGQHACDVADLNAKTRGCPMPVGVWVKLEACRALLARIDSKAKP